MCLSGRGKPKKPYDSFDEANEAALKSHGYMRAYKCKKCPAWHVASVLSHKLTDAISSSRRNHGF